MESGEKDEPEEGSKKAGNSSGDNDADMNVENENNEEEDLTLPWPGSKRPLHVKFCNQPLTKREGTVFDPRPKNQKVLTPWEEVETEANAEEGGEEGKTEQNQEKQTYYVNHLTEETSWVRPEELDQYVQDPAGANVVLVDNGLGAGNLDGLSGNANMLTNG